MLPAPNAALAGRRLWWALPAALCLVLSACGGGGTKDDQLDDLMISGAELSPPFDPDQEDYTAEVPNDVTSVTVTPTAEDPAATVTVNGTAVPSGSPSAPIPLTVGENTISIVVTAEDGDSETYTVVVSRRAPPGSNPALASLALTAAELDQLFDPGITSYTASVGYLGASTRVVAEPEDAGATLALGGTPLIAGAPSPYVALNPGATSFEVEVTAEDGSATLTYAVEVNRAGRATLQQEAYVKASNTGPDFFGRSVALARDILVVGAPSEGSAASGVDGDQNDNSFTDAGAAYVFERTGSGWEQTAYLKASDPGDPDLFGGAVAADGDLVVVGAEGEQSLATGVDGDDSDDSSSQVGAVYLFERDGMGVWSQNAYLKASNADRGDEFGHALDADAGRVIVGAWSEDSSATGVNGDGGNDDRPGSGAAYVFARDQNGGWVQEAYLKASNPDGGDEFGRSVTISGASAAVGAPFEDSSATGVGGDETRDDLSATGAVYLFQRDASGEWAQVAYVKASNTDAGDRFGSSMALDGDLLAVGAPREDSAAGGIDGDEADDSLDAAGAVYVFERDDAGDWAQIAYVKASTPDSGDNFGSSLALSGNLLVVSAPGENSAASGIDGDELDDSAVDSGAVYVFERDDAGNWAQIAYLKASNPDAGDLFGTSVAFDGDTLAVGAELEQSAATGIDGDELDDSLDAAGAVYVFR